MLILHPGAEVFCRIIKSHLLALRIRRWTAQFFTMSCLPWSTGFLWFVSLRWCLCSAHSVPTGVSRWIRTRKRRHEWDRLPVARHPPNENDLAFSLSQPSSAAFPRSSISKTRFIPLIFQHLLQSERCT
ncbi:hypothetical protein BDZ89DRAFT_467338 [Hymenopellis radicata]|nr:hypothetical protein BDZ89DRAFT_467338 [Hymenopellis radicata]